MDLESIQSDNSKSCTLSSIIPKITKTSPCLLGVDEAGRGPVLGPMVYGVCYCPLEFKEKLKEMKVADSKTLTEENREQLFKTIHEANESVGWMIDVISPNIISTNMLRRAKYNLNALSHDAAINLIQAVLNKGVNLKEVYVDTVGDPEKYQHKLSNLFPGISITVAKKADSTYPIVSAASICAKVARDNVLKNWKFIENLDIEANSWGSGYPNDPKTKQFIQSHVDQIFGYPQIVRFSWSTAEKLLEKNAAEVTWEDTENTESVNQPAAANLLSFFKRTSKPSAKQYSYHPYFKNRLLSNVSQL